MAGPGRLCAPAVPRTGAPGGVRPGRYGVQRIVCHGGERLGSARWMAEHSTPRPAPPWPPASSAAPVARPDLPPAPSCKPFMNKIRLSAQRYTSAGSYQIRSNAALSGQLCPAARGWRPCPAIRPQRQLAGYDRWVAKTNNASFAAQAAYDELVPAFEACSNARPRLAPVL